MKKQFNLEFNQFLTKTKTDIIRHESKKINPNSAFKDKQHIQFKVFKLPIFMLKALNISQIVADSFF